MFLLAYTTWAWAGLRPSYHWVGVGTAGILLAGLFRSVPRVLARDPLFYLGLAFLGLLAIQWANAGRELYFDVGYQKWMYTPPRWPGWPSAFARADALQMLTWFFPAWVVVLVFRMRIFSRRETRGLLRFLACNAGLLAIFGIVQMASGTESIYWTQPLGGHFFASFAYCNHAGPFFVLTGALAAGLLLAELLEIRDFQTGKIPQHVQHPGRVAVLSAALLLCLAGAVLGFSRTGIILAGVLALFTLVYGWMRAWRILSPARRLNLAALTLAGLASLGFLIVGFGEKGVRKEFTPRVIPPEMGTLSTWERIDFELSHRPLWARAALLSWREEPWFGLGGWGYKYRVAEHVPRHYWKKLEKSKGGANVHVDFLQFLAEFGVVGIGLILGTLGVMVSGWFRPGVHRGALWTLGACGLALTVVASAVDIPFRSPAILYTWLAILAAIPQACRPGVRQGESLSQSSIPERIGS